MKLFTLLSFCFSLLSGPLLAYDDHVDRFPDIAEKAIPAVVTIRVEMGSKDPEGLLDPLGDDFLRRFFSYGFSPFDIQKRELPPAQGSGVLVTDNGVILTNSHVVNGYKIITVVLNDGEEYEGRILGADPQTDLAVVKIEAEHTPYLPLGDSSKLRVAEPIIAIGNPFGLKATTTKGIVSATGRANLDIANFEDFIQTDAAINRGNSGGPLINVKGEIVGINTAIGSNSSGSYMGIGFAIPSNMAKEVLDQILASGKVSRGFLGVDLQPMTLELARAFGLEKPQGAILADVTPGSAAEKAGLLRGDVILTINGKAVESKASLRTQVALMSPGAQVHLGIKRGDSLLTVPVVLGERPEAQKVAQETTASVNKLGLVVEALSPDAAKSLGHGNEQGVVITKIDPKSPVGRIGIKKGALILSVNRQKVTTTEEFVTALGKETPEGILLEVKQDGAVRYVFLRGV